MKSLYLKRITLKEFRSFAHLDIELPGEPGVLIVHGSNGLGKSSLFDSLEWILSDNINHFRDVSGAKKTGAYLCRWRESEKGTTSAAIQFSDGSFIERSLASPKAINSQLGGDVLDITKFLRSTNWRQPISDLQRYLPLTHFLGQSTFSRLAYCDPSDRFDILKEAARSTDIDSISSSLHGQGNTSVARTYSRRIDELEREVNSLSELLAQEATLFSETQVSGAIDDHNAGAEARRIIEQLNAGYFSPPKATSSSEANVDLIIEEMLKSLDNVEHQCLSAEKLIGEARRLSGNFTRTRIDIADIVASDRTYKTHAEDIRKALEEARTIIEQQREAILKFHSAFEGKKVIISSLRALTDARSLIVKLETEQHTQTTLLDSFFEIKNKSEKEVTLAERRQQIRSRVRTESIICEEEIGRLRIKKTTIEKILLTQAEISRKTTELAELQSAFPDLEMNLRRCEQDAAIANNDVVSQQLLVSELRVAVDEMSSAVATLATRLPQDTCECPLCDSHFDSPTTLSDRVSNAAQRLAPALTTQESVLKEKLSIREQHLAYINKLKDGASRIERDSLQLQLQKQSLADLISDFGVSNVGSSNLVTRLTQLDDEVARVNVQNHRKLRWLSHPMLDADIWTTEHSRAIRARDAAQRSFDGALRASDDINNALQRARLEEERTLGLVGTDRWTLTQDLPTKLFEEEELLKGLMDEISRLTHMQNETSSSVAILDAETKGIQARLTEMSERKAILEGKLRDIYVDWEALQQFGTVPDVTSIDSLSRRLLTSRHILQEVKPQIARLREGRFAWARQRSHGTVLEQIRQHVKATADENRDQLLTQVRTKLTQKQEELKSTIEVKAIAKEASAEINAELAEFNSEYIKPLGNLMSQFNQAILCDPRIGIDLHVKNKKVEQIAIKGDQIPKGGKIDPLLVHSEGQMAALAVSMLCAASLTFPWSRWKALILDDPLQHNDSIHVAAFSDLMANLISSEGYQVLISTHDIAQAEFLQRKFSSRRIPCKTLSLLGQGTNGVEWSMRTERSADPITPEERSAINITSERSE